MSSQNKCLNIWVFTFVLKILKTLKILLSPSKNLNSNVKFTARSTPQFLPLSEEIMAVLKKLTPPELTKIHDINLKLAELNYTRNQNWSVDTLKATGTPALFTFAGDVYRGLDAHTLDIDDVLFANDVVYILSGLYGILRPLDAMLPYRLEMGTSVSIGSCPDLYHFWKDELTRLISSPHEDFIVNLASKEYSDAIDFKKLNIPVYECTFLDKVKGQHRPVNIFLKKARGLMARFIIKNRIRKPSDLQYFDYENYVFDPELSDGRTFVFKRH